MSRLSIEQRFAEFEETAAPSFRPMGLSETISRVRLRRRRRRAAVALVAVVALAAPVAWFARPTPPAPAVAQGHVPLPGPEFSGFQPRLEFQDAETGWAVFHNCRGGQSCSLALLSTADGGRHWRRVTLPALPAFADGLELYALNRTTFSLWVRGPEQEFLLTRDGGAHFERYPQDRPPVEAVLARGGRYQMLCPNATGFGDNVCPEQQLVRIGEGVLPFVRPWADEPGRAMNIINAPDGRLWLTNKPPNDHHVALSTDNAKTWQVIESPSGVFTLSPDGREAWMVGYGVVWRFNGTAWDGDGWPILPNTQLHAAALGDGVLLVANGDGMAYLKDRRPQPIPGLKAGVAVGLADGTAIVVAFDGSGTYLGTGTGTDRQWTFFSAQ
jgi:hypothetical protein